MMKREQNEMIMRYLEEVKKKILLNISHYAKIDSSMRVKQVKICTLNNMKKKLKSDKQISEQASSPKTNSMFIFKGLPQIQTLFLDLYTTLKNLLDKKFSIWCKCKTD
ncbi:hypothetical protein H5410_062532 [Solanum commersonii]|uniref:Uncharacterized protein n=1 Tax=Solanum commersonii TaxID=4109 RepID=A0A9J5WCY1_SOLCO|nr:hypothetical protein H5410_062532 [Solanum commersonii]